MVVFFYFYFLGSAYCFPQGPGPVNFQKGAGDTSPLSQRRGESGTRHRGQAAPLHADTAQNQSQKLYHFRKEAGSSSRRGAWH